MKNCLILLDGYINTPPLTLKNCSESSDYHYHHHFDKDDLERLSVIFPGVYPNKSEKNINAWAMEMKAVLKRLIQTGQFEKIQDSEKSAVTFIWVEND